jgi:ABC-type glycerol-3-phosphate transport system substrate-binding protein
MKTKFFALTGASLLGLMMTANAVNAQQSGYLSFLIDNGPQSVAVAEAWVAAYTEKNPDVTIDIEVPGDQPGPESAAGDQRTVAGWHPGQLQVGRFGWRRSLWHALRSGHGRRHLLQQADL